MNTWGTWTKYRGFGGQQVSVIDITESTEFDFASIGTCLLWIDPADAATVTVATGISQITDKSGNGANATQAVGASQPAYAIAAQNGKNAIAGTVTQSLEITLVNSQAFTVAWTYLADDTLRFVFDDLDGTSRVAAFDNGAFIEAFAGTQVQANATSNAWHVVVVLYNGAASHVWLDGVDAVPAGIDLGLNNLATIRLGNRFNEGTGGLPFIGDFIVYDGALSDPDRITVETELASKWGI